MRTPQQSLGALKGVALGISAFFLAMHLWSWLLVAPILIRQGACDFRASYAAGYMVLHGMGHQLYDFSLQEQVQNAQVTKQATLPFISPPYEALMFAPLARFSFRTAYFSFLALNFGLLSLCLYLLWSFTTKLRSIYSWLPIALCLGFLPIGAALLQGQRSIVLLALLCGTFILLRRSRGLVAGLLLGSSLFKFTVALPVVLLFLLWRRWRFIAGFGFSAAAMVLLSIGLIGVRESWNYARLIGAISRSSVPVGQTASSIPLTKWNYMANLHGLLYGLGIHGAFLEIGSVLLGLGVLACAYTWGRTATDPQRLLIAIPTSVLVGHYLFFHDLSVLFLPILILLDKYALSECDPGHCREHLIVRVTMLTFVSMIMLSYAYAHFYVIAIVIAAFLWCTALPAKANSGCALLRRNPRRLRCC